MSEDNSNSIDTQDDLDLFSTSFFKGESAEPEAKEEVEEVSETVDAEDTSDEEDTLATEDDDEVEEEEEPAPKPKKKSAQERINDITREKHEAIREAERLRAELAEARTSKAKEEPKTVQKASNAPTPDDTNDDGTDKYPLGEYDPSFIADRVRFEIAQENAVRDEETRQRNEQLKEEQAKTELFNSWESKMAAAEANLPDLRSSAQTLYGAFSGVDENYGNYLSSVIMSMDKGPEVLYYLANHLDEAENIISSGPTAATIALGRLESRYLEDGTKVKKPKVSQAPEPPPANRGTNGRFEVADDTDDLDAFADKFFVKRK